MTEEQHELFQEDIYDAFKHAVKALGGAKKVAGKLWPDKPIDQATQLLLKCLDPERPEKLDLYQIVWILREAGKRSCHVAMNKLGSETHYECRPVDPEEEKDQLKRQYINAVSELGALAKRLEQLDKQ